MKVRGCDVCRSIIQPGTNYYKVSILEHIDKRQQLNHASDICLRCYTKKFKNKGGVYIERRE
jgi:hypothetical protein